MDSLLGLPAGMLPLAGLEGRAAPRFLGPAEPGGDPAGASLPFDFLLAQLANSPLPAGDALPSGGNDLPPPAAVPFVAPAVLSSAVGAETAAPPIFPAQLGTVAPSGLPPAANAPLPAAQPAAFLPPAPAPADAAAMDALLATEPAPVPGSAVSPAKLSEQRDASLADPSAWAAEIDAPAPELPARPLPTAADLAAPQPAARVLAELAAASSGAPAERSVMPRDAKSPVTAAAALADAGTEQDVQIDAQVARPAPAAQDLDLPRMLAGDGTITVTKPLRGETPPLPLLHAAPSADTAAQTSAVGHAPAHSVGASSAASGAGTGTSAAQSSALMPQHPQGSVDTMAERWHDALANRVQWLVDHDVSEARIKLNPPELGAVDVKISLHDDKTFVQLTAHASSARDELTQSLPRLRELLSMNGLELGGATVDGGRDERGADQPRTDFPVRALDFGGGTPDTDVTPSRSRATSRIDLFA